MRRNTDQRDEESIGCIDPKRFKGVRRRKWGKWVSEIRVPGTQERLWLGSYSSPEAAAVAHDIASYCLRGPSSIHNLNFPLILPASVQENMSPESIRRAASDAGMAVDAQMIMNKSPQNGTKQDSESSGVRGLEMELWQDCGFGNSSEGEELSISIEDYL